MFYKKRIIEKADIGSSYSTSVKNAIDPKKVERIKKYLKIIFILGLIGLLLMLDTIWGGQLDIKK